MEEGCPICLTDEIVDSAIITTCKHRFCYECISNWAKSKLICPLCKVPFETIQQSSPSSSSVISFPAPVIPIVDSSKPDLECLTDSYFLQEISRLLQSSEQLQSQFAHVNRKTKNTFVEKKNNDVLAKLRKYRHLFEIEINADPHMKFNPAEVLTELYQIEAILTLLRSGRIEELAANFPLENEESTSAQRRYGADDYDQLEDDENLVSNMKSIKINVGQTNTRKKGKKTKNRKKVSEENENDGDYYSHYY